MTLPFNSLSTHEFAPHRKGVNVVDASAPITQRSGVNADGYESAVASANLSNGTATSATATVYYWDDVAGKFIASSDTATLSNGTGTFTFSPKGRTFWVGITALTGGNGATAIDVSCKAAPMGRSIDGY